MRVVPARAGVFPDRDRWPWARSRGPRACGGVPVAEAVRIIRPEWSPRVRGCSPYVTCMPRGRIVVPARAGVFPRGTVMAAWVEGGPRACGGVPCTPSATPTAGSWSPRVRGCSRLRLRDHRHDDVVPARAGVFPMSATASGPWRRGPRACGGVPHCDASSLDDPMWSPRVRGCSRTAVGDHGRHQVVPARAGVFPRQLPVPWRRLCGPRACGGVPRQGPRNSTIARWSPRVRGCSRSRETAGRTHRVVPARAGVFPSTTVLRCRESRGPRACVPCRRDRCVDARGPPQERPRPL